MPASRSTKFPGAKIHPLVVDDDDSSMTSWPADFFVGEWRVIPKLSKIARDGQSVGVKHKSMAVLVCLAEANGEVVSRNDIMDSVWPGMEVTDDVLTQSIVELRKAFDDDARNSRVIETVPRIGFRLIATVAPVTADLDTATPGPLVVPVTGRRYWLAGIALLVVVAFLWILLDRQESTRSPVVTIEEPPSIAVLPFVNVSDDPDNEYFADGLSEEILILLARIPRLKVIGRTSSFSFKGKNEDLRVIGQTLGVNNVLEGSVRKAGDRVRIAAQLVDVADGAQVWSAVYDRTMTDIFDVQNDVAAAITDALKVHVSSNPTRGRPTEVPEAYVLFLKARVLISANASREAVNVLLKVIDLDPNFAEAYELLAWAYWSQAGKVITNAESQKLTGAAAAKALDRDPDLVFAQALYHSAFDAADSLLLVLRAYERALREQPGNEATSTALIFNLIENGYLKEALRIAERSVEIDPLSLSANYYLVNALYAAGHTSEAAGVLQVTDQLDPNGAKWSIGNEHLAAKRDDPAIANYEAHLQQNGLPGGWVRDLVTNARDPETGMAYLDRRIPQIVASMPEEEAFQWRRNLNMWYLLFGFLDRYYELILDFELSAKKWTDADDLVHEGTVFRRLGFTAHPKYLEVAESLDIIGVWEQRGPPDYCDKASGQWICE